MEPKEKLYYLLSEYVCGHYDTETFCDIFTVTYDIKVDYSTLNMQEKALFEELCKLTARFSANEKDLAISNVYIDEQKIKEKILQVYKELAK
jgi:galactitol-specific phosphotransferase system IIB component